jgi:hypothetical protein
MSAIVLLRQGTAPARCSGGCYSAPTTTLDGGTRFNAIGAAGDTRSIVQG